LISQDFQKNLQAKLLPFIRKWQLESALYLMTNIDYNSWIDLVDPSWSGAIPATLIINTKTGHRIFVEHELRKGEIEKLVNKLKS